MLAKTKQNLPHSKETRKIVSALVFIGFCLRGQEIWLQCNIIPFEGFGMLVAYSTTNLKIYMAVVTTSPGKIVCEMKVEEEHVNRAGNLHGGVTATLVDVVSTTALLSTERALPGVSVDMNITYMNAAKLGEDIIITAEVLKEGKSLAFTTVDVTNKVTGKLLAQGRHTKYLGT
ncbi:acyl-coenzyme A thioesterase 13 isoform X2 [Hemitrygon akajei]|uniref:acyl-coenzyme A thioesterase 13 isoform X2 n=1 Tax=Hemitrygon akajei TaxID=2704970 RepID=UPI003BF9673C